MSQSLGPALLGFLAGVVVAGSLVYAALSVRLFTERRRARREALGQSRATLKGQLVEQLLPLLPEFHFDARDARFLGAPIDYVVFDGYSDGDEVEVVLVEVKTGNARLSDGEKRIRDAVKRGRVRFDVVRVDG